MNPRTILLPLAVLLLTGPSAAAEPAGPSATEAVTLETNVPELYPRHSDICLSTYEQMSDAPGVLLRLDTDVENFSHYRYTIRRGANPADPPRMSRDGAIGVRFDSRNRKPQRIVTVIEAVSKWGRTSKPFSITLAYHPSVYYAASGRRSRNWLAVQASDLALCGSSVDDWIVDRPSPEERAYARRRWGRVVRPLAGDYEKAKAIACELVRALVPHVGIPSDSMRNATPFEQLERAEAGRDRVWCANYADIFSTACNALDIPVRKIDMQHVWSSEGKTSFQIAEGHRTTEVFDRDLNRWVWMDLTLGIWGAHLNHREPLHVADLVRVLNDEHRKGRLRLVQYDPVKGIERVVPLARSRHRSDLLKYFKQDQRFQYVRKTQVAGP